MPRRRAAGPETANSCRMAAVRSASSRRRCVLPNRGPVSRLRDELQARRTWAPVGWRYPAWGADNALQLLSGRHDGHDDARLSGFARLAADDRVDALQLELSVPLRWPGPWRESFLAATELALADYEGANAAGGDSVAGRAAVVIETRAAGPSRARPGWQVVPRVLPAGARSEPDAQGLYEIYPRAAYYALQRVFQLDPYGPGTDLATIRAHFAAITPMAAVLAARGDAAAPSASGVAKLRVSGARSELDTVSTGGKNISTPALAGLACKCPTRNGIGVTCNVFPVTTSIR